MHRTLLSIVLFTAVSGSALCAEPETPVYDRVHLSASAEADVESDRLVVIMSAQAEGVDAATPADQVNRTMEWALSMLKDLPEVKVQTLGYRSDAIYDGETIRGWRVRQSLRMQGRDSRVLGDLVAMLQDQLQVTSVGYHVSDELRRERMRGLTQTALERFQGRARHIAESLGRADYRLVSIRIHDGRQVPMRTAGGMLADASPAVAQARLEPGTQQLSVSVSGEIELTAD
jgi:predicted secreted protein